MQRTSPQSLPGARLGDRKSSGFYFFLFLAVFFVAFFAFFFAFAITRSPLHECMTPALQEKRSVNVGDTGNLNAMMWTTWHSRSIPLLMFIGAGAPPALKENSGKQGVFLKR
ncbi:MAG: hypothetical protein NT049_09300 [Planctomycetota bacterium]|nr:hypothetical protein [Planctomycetota bacterium]